MEPLGSASKTGGGTPVAVLGLVGAILGGLAGCVSAQASFSGGLEHGSPGMGAGIAFIALLRMGFGAMIGLFIGAAFGAMAK